MPYIAVNTARTLTPEECRSVKSGMGERIPIIPNKTEQLLMVDFSEGRATYLSGAEMENGAFVDVRMYGSAGVAVMKKFTETVFALLEWTLANRLGPGLYGHWGVRRLGGQGAP